MTLSKTLTLGLALLAAVLVRPVTAGEFPDSWYYDRPDEHMQFEGKDAPALTVGDWVGEEFKSEDMKGQILVIDLWATWCGPCLAAMPHNTELAKEYADQGVKLIGVCVSGDAAQMPGLVKDRGAEYPNAFVVGEQVATDWPIQWYPTYAVVDREGVVRAIGLKPDRIKDVIESLLDEEAELGGRARIRSEWLEGDSEKRARLQNLENQAEAPPALDVENWINSEALKLEDLKGKVVVLDFWATWCGPCIRSIPQHNAMLEKYGQEGLVIIGVCASHGGESMAATAKEHGIKYPIALDIDNKTNTAYGPNGFPDYYIIDRAGNLRIADCANGSLEEAVVALLAEPAPGEEPEAPEADEVPLANDAAAAE